MWVTEFACTNWSAERPLGKEVVEAFLRESVRYLDGLEWVERYAWFGVGTGREMGNVGRYAALLDEREGERGGDGDGGRVSELGRVYMNG